MVGLGPQHLTELDGRLEEAIKAKFTALVNVCMSHANMLKDVSETMVAAAAGYAAEQLPPTDVAQLFLDQHPDEEQALGEVEGFFQEAVPELAPTGDPRRAELCVVAVPAGPAGERFCALVRKALPETEIHYVSGGDDIVFYRELSNLPLAQLEQLGPIGQDAYRQMNATDHFTPHCRTDVNFSRKN